MQLEKLVRHKMEPCKLRDILIEFAKEIEALKRPATVTENKSTFISPKQKVGK